MRTSLTVLVTLITLSLTAVACSRTDTAEDQTDAADAAAAVDANAQTATDAATDKMHAETKSMDSHAHSHADDHHHGGAHDHASSDDDFPIKGMKKLDMGSQIPTFELKDAVSESILTQESVQGDMLTVVAFMCNHCPFVLNWEPRLIEYANDYADKGVKVVSINPNLGHNLEDDNEMKRETPAMMKARAEKLEFPYPYLVDEDQSIAKAFGATNTPHVYVFHKDNGLVYVGKIDDNHQEPEQVTRHYLREATDAFLAGETYEVTAEMGAQGCGIKWIEQREAAA